MIKDVIVDGRGLKTTARKIKAQAAGRHLKTILRSQLFKKYILEMDRSYWLKGCSKNCKFKSKSNLWIYETLMNGQEEGTEVDYVANLQIVQYYTLAKVIGYMTPGKPKIYVNIRYFDGMLIIKVVSNFGHEWTHVLGARHSGPWIRQSFPYFMNQVIEKCYSHLITKGLPDIVEAGLANIVIPTIEQPEYELITERKFLFFKSERAVVMA